MKFRSFKTSREFHKWTGFVCAIFLLILSFSGILLMHRDSLNLDRIEVSANYLPDKYFQQVRDKLVLQSIAVTPDDPQIIFAGTGSGLFRSRDGGENWTPLHDGLRDDNIRSLAISPADSSIIYAGTSKGIYLSEDGGDHWTDWFEESSGLNSIDVQEIVIHPRQPERLYAATRGGLFVSEDGGDTWEPSFKGNSQAGDVDVKFIRFSSKAKSLYIGTSDGVFKSIDGGRHWEEKWKGALPSPQSLLSLDTDPEFIYAGTDSGLYKSYNRGITWIREKLPENESVRKVEVDPIKTTDIYMATHRHFYVSPDGGDSWNPLSLDMKAGDSLGAWTLVHFDSKAPPMLIAGTSGGLYLSFNGGRDWRETSLAETIQQKSGGHLKMDLVKLMTEIHTGRFFGDYVYLLVDIATVGLVLLTISGFAMTLYRRRVAKSKKVREQITEEVAVDNILNIQETADDLSQESHEIHDMIEHINTHLAKCRTVYISKEKKEIDKIGKHISTLDKKMHHLMDRIEEFHKSSQN